MTHKLKKFIKRYWTLLWIIAALAVMLSAVVYAAFTKTNKAKSVVARYGTVSSRFSSNYLEETGREKPVYVTSTDGKFGDTVLISNYSQTNPTFHYDTVINYKLEMKLGYLNGSNFVPINGSTSSDVFDLGERYIIARVTGNNGFAKTVRFGYNSGDSITYEDTIYKSGDNYLLSLPGTASVSDAIELEFSADQKESLFAETPTYDKKLYLEITATPDPLSSYTGLTALSAQICLAQSAKVESITWTGDYNENMSAGGKSPDELDGYNYVIQGMGSGTALLRWKPQYIEANEQFLLEELGLSIGQLPTESGGWKTIVFTVDSNAKNRYDLQFYRSGSEDNASYATWDDMKNYVEFVFPYTAN